MADQRPMVIEMYKVCTSSTLRISNIAMEHPPLYIIV